MLQIAPDHMLVQASGAVSQVEQAFQVKINDYALRGESHFSNDRDPSLPAAISSVVSSIAGLDSFSDFHSMAHSHKSLSSSQIVYDPWQTATAYNFPNAPNHYPPATVYDGTAVTIAIATAYSYTPSDIDYFLNFEGVSRTGTITDVPVNGGSTTPNYETTLDVEESAVQASGANILVYEVPNNSFANFQLMYNQIVSDNTAQVFSISWVACEPSVASYIRSSEAIFKQGSAKGMTFFVGSGDDGAYGCSSTSTTLAVEYPSSSVYFAAIGGTNLYTNKNSQYSSETAWTSSGGGISSEFLHPSWQHGPGVPKNGKRDLADASFDASATTAQWTYYQGQWNYGYGTSYGGPNWAALWSFAIQAKSGARLGNAAPYLYEIGRSSTNYKLDFHDVTTGNNGNGNGPGYNATKNWDYPTGWGSPNGTNLVNWLKSN